MVEQTVLDRITASVRSLTLVESHVLILTGPKGT